MTIKIFGAIPGRNRAHKLCKTSWIIQPLNSWRARLVDWFLLHTKFPASIVGWTMQFSFSMMYMKDGMALNAPINYVNDVLRDGCLALQQLKRFSVLGRNWS